MNFSIIQVESLPEPNFNKECKFICLSPIAVSSIRERLKPKKIVHANPAEDYSEDEYANLEKHYLDYMNLKEREPFIKNMQKNLINKFQTYYNKDYPACEHDFKFSFDINYITKRQGKISKLIHFKKISKNVTTKIKAFEAPFEITADPDLSKIGYDTGFGNDNSAGLGCVGFFKDDS